MGKKRGGQPGNLNALKHGFYSKQFKKGEFLDLEEEWELVEEIGMMRVVTRRLLEMALDCNDLKEQMEILGALGLASTRIAGLMKAQKFLGGNKDKFIELFERVRDEVFEEEWAPFRK